VIGSPLTILFMPESVYGPTNNCIGIGNVLRRRGGSDRRQADHCDRGGLPDDLICPSHREPPAVITNSVVRAMLIMYVRCESDLGRIVIMT
jgi:hypothetical protein